MSIRIPPWLIRTLGVTTAYLAWGWVFKLISITIITYLLLGQNPSFQEINDFYASQEMLLVGLCAGSFLTLYVALHPVLSLTLPEVIDGPKIQRRFFPGLIQGAGLAISITLVFVLSGAYRYLGFFIQSEDPGLAFVNLSLRVFGLVLLAYCEEFIFRQRILGSLRGRLTPATAILLTALLYIAVKSVQFDLGIRQLLTLFLISVALGVRAFVSGEFARGAGIWAGFLVMLQAGLSLPVFGTEFQGLILVRYESIAESDSLTQLWVSGGVAGPLSSLGLLFLILIDLATHLLKNRRIFFPAGGK